MIGQQQFVHFSYQWVLAFILSGLLCLSSLTWAEVATATDGAAETIVAGKMIQGQQAASSNKVSSTNTDAVPQPPIANDMAKFNAFWITSMLPTDTYFQFYTRLAAFFYCHFHQSTNTFSINCLERIFR